MTTILELRQPLWMETPKGEALAILLTDYGPESDHLWTCIQQEGEHQGELWTWHNSEVRVLPNSSMLRRATLGPAKVDTVKEVLGRVKREHDLRRATERALDRLGDRTIGEVINDVKSEATLAVERNEPPMMDPRKLHRGEQIPRGYRQVIPSWGRPVLLRLDLPDDYPEHHRDEIP